MPKKIPTTAVVFVVDRSGSMSSLGDMPGKWLREQAQSVATDPAAQLGVVWFGSEVRQVPFGAAKSFEPVYAADMGGTALYDAVHTGIAMLRSRAEERRLLVVITDGEENASAFMGGDKGRSALKKEIADMRAQGNFTEVWIGGEIDTAKAFVQDLGASGLNTFGYKGPQGFVGMAAMTNAATSKFMRSASLSVADYAALAKEPQDGEEPKP